MSVLSPRMENLNMSSENKENQVKSSPTKTVQTRDGKTSTLSDSKPEVRWLFFICLMLPDWGFI